MQRDSKKILKTILISIFFLFIAVFVFFRSYDLIFGVKIKGVNITDGAKYTESHITINGNARNAKILKLNGREISVNKEGDFFETIALLPGYNIITLEAQDKFGHLDMKNYKLMH